MGEPTIYKPSIYKGNGIYNNGAGGGGGGGSNIIGGREYHTILMPDGNEWTIENLDFKFCLIGGSGSPTTPHAWYYANNESDYGLEGTYKCGLLYNWYAIKLLNDYKNELIPGWHVPSVNEWLALNTACGSNGAKKMKAKDGAVISGFPSGWNGDDLYGFFALPTGYYFSGFNNFGLNCGFWTAEESGSDGRYTLFDYRDSPSIGTNDNKQIAFSVRLVKNTN